MTYLEGCSHDSKFSSSDRNNKPVICLEDIVDNTCKTKSTFESNLSKNIEDRGPEHVTDH